MRKHRSSKIATDNMNNAKLNLAVLFWQRLIRSNNLMEIGIQKLICNVDIIKNLPLWWWNYISDCNNLHNTRFGRHYYNKYNRGKKSAPLSPPPPQNIFQSITIPDVTFYIRLGSVVLQLTKQSGCYKHKCNCLLKQ